jgi:hypothetical protein
VLTGQPTRQATQKGYIDLLIESDQQEALASIDADGADD